VYPEITLLTDEQRLSASLRFLSAASKTLASSFDYSQTLARVAALVVPDFGTGFAVEIGVADDERTTVVTAGDVPGFTDVLAGSTARDFFFDFALIARGRELGTMRIAPDPKTTSDHDLFDELAVRIAVAVDSAQIYAREHHVADTLQRALLPDRLPQAPHQHLDAAYLPGAEEAIVGGDWYDAFTLPDGRIALSIGDVAGHGLRAAIVMGEVRQAFRAAALNPKSPSLVLERANTIVNMRANPVMVTAIFGILDPTTSTFTYASAGHPPPILALACGTVQRLPTEGIPLGISDSIDARDWTFTMPPGSLIALYTDGLIEYSRDVIEGEERLLDALRAEVLDGSPTPARSLVRRIFATTKNTDDVAALVVVAEDVVSPNFSFDFTAIPIAVPLVRRSLQRYASRLKLDDDQTFALITSVGEAMANAVEHAYPDSPGIVRLRIANDDCTLTISVEDDGRWKPAQKRDERGRGLPLMRALMNGVEIRTHQSMTSVRLTLAIDEQPPQAATA
jgi:anti-sigma regulatory factor (Ser/Thr protein kinase)